MGHGKGKYGGMVRVWHRGDNLRYIYVKGNDEVWEGMAWGRKVKALERMWWTYGERIMAYEEGVAMRIGRVGHWLEKGVQVR